MIIFKKVRFKNFLSYGNNYTEVILNKSPTTCITGGNGSGKSASVLDTVCYGLYGNPYRDINKPNLVNSINGGNLVVELEFDSGTKQYKIVRGMKPGIFEIYENGKLIPQDSAKLDYQKMLETQILKMNERVFRQIVLVGSANYVPFMLLKSSARRDVIEELLDIKIFSTMNSLAKEKVSSLKEQIRDVEYNIDILQEKILLQKKHIADTKKEKQDKIVSLEEDINKLNFEIENLLAENERLLSEKEQHLPKLSFKDKIESSLKKVQTLKTELSTKKKHIDGQLDFFANNTDCPVCKQHINEEHKHSLVHEHTTELESLLESLNSANQEIEKKKVGLQKLNSLSEILMNIDRKMYQISQELSVKNSQISKNRKEIDSIQKSVVSNTLKDELKENETILKSTIDTRNKLLDERTYYDVMLTMLKDNGIKSKIIKQYIPVMNSLINKYLDKFGLPIEFTLDEEFNESIKSRYRDCFSYNNFSEGEKQRIDCAILFAWRDIARMKNSINCNLLVLDETFDSSLDVQATEELLNILLASDKNTNIFVISHKADLTDKVRSHLQFEKVGNFSFKKDRPD